MSVALGISAAVQWALFAQSGDLMFGAVALVVSVVFVQNVRAERASTRRRQERRSP